MPLVCQTRGLIPSIREDIVMRYSVAVCLLGALCLSLQANAAVTIKDRTLSQPLVLDQNEDYFLHKVYISGVTDAAALTLTGKINSVSLANCVFSNIWSGINGKAAGIESQGAIVGSFVATDTAFEDAQHQLLCFREGAFGTVTFQRCKFRTTDSFLKKIYAEDPWRTTPPTTEFANIDRLELLDNEYLNTILIIHPSVKVVIFRGDMTNVRLQSSGTHVIRLEKGQDPSTIFGDGTALADAAKQMPQAQQTAEADGKSPAEPASSPTEARSSEPVSGGETDQTAPVPVLSVVTPAELLHDRACIIVNPQP
jgi:hypothetical protein